MSMHKGLIGKTEGGGSVSNELLEQCYKSGQISEQQWQEHLATEQTLGDYIARKQRQAAFDDVAKEKKLTFDEWYVMQFGNKTMVNYAAYSWVWDAAQENT